MATATVTLSPGYNLTGDTNGRNSAPVTYSLNGVQLGQAASTGGFEYTGFKNPNSDTYTLVVAGKTVATNLTSGELETITAALRPATGQIQQTISREVKVAAPAPPPSRPLPPAPKPVVTETENAVVTRVNGVDLVVEKKPVVTETETQVVTRTGGVDIVVDKPPTTTDPSRPPLPLGDNIDDIYDPNLTPEQVASLSPGDRQARDAFFADEDAGGTEGDTSVDEIVVTGIRERPNAFNARADWRVRLALSDDPSVNYLYKAPDPGILNPLNATNGVIFPYTPTISVNYSASYNPTELVHSNYKVFQYSSSGIDSITITSDFTAQDTYEANYLLAVIHFFRSATKMFYGQDQNPRRGTPPPLCYIYGMGSYQFAGQPLAIQQFSYNLPNNVDYIRTSVGGTTTIPPTSNPSRLPPEVAKGGVVPPPNFTPTAEDETISWVPSKIQLSVSCVPMMNRNAVSNVFSFEEYATGRLLNGIGKRSGGFW